MSSILRPWEKFAKKLLILFFAVVLQLCFLSAAAAAAVAVHLSVKLFSDLYVCFVPNFHLFLCLFDALFFLCLFSHLSALSLSVYSRVSAMVHQATAVVRFLNLPANSRKKCFVKKIAGNL